MMGSVGLLKPVAVLTVLCLVMAALLGVTDAVTRQRIEEQQAQAATEVRTQLLAGASAFEPLSLSDEQRETFGAVDLYAAAHGAGYVATMAVSGYGGVMQVMVGVDASLQVTGVSVLNSSETPGLGKRTEDDAFLAQFVGAQEPLTVVRGDAAADEISAVTGATISSRAMAEAVNQALMLVKTVAGGDEA